MAKMKKWLKKVWQEQGYTLLTLGAAIAKYPAVKSSCEKARVSSWFGNEGIPQDVVLPLLDELGISPLETLWRMDEDDVGRYIPALVEDEEVSAAVLELFAGAEEELDARLSTSGLEIEERGKASRGGRAKG